MRNYTTKKIDLDGMKSAVVEALNESAIIAVGIKKDDEIIGEFAFGLGDVDGVKVMRYCGEALKPNGVGSHSVIASWGTPNPLDVEELSKTLIHGLECVAKRNKLINGEYSFVRLDNIAW